MKIYIQSYGCQANFSDSEAMAGILKSDGHEIIKEESKADLIIVNTCSVKNKTQSKEIEYIKNRSQKQRVIVGGCLTKTIDIRKYAPNVKAVFDTNSILKINDIVKNNKDSFSNKKEIERLSVPVIRKSSNIAIIPIAQGCLNRCSFCATKIARGNLMSYRIGNIKRLLEIAVHDGCSIIYLTSQDNGCYGFDIKTDLSELLNILISVEGNYKIRVGMTNPWHVVKILDKLIDCYKSDKIIKFLHIPLQSGSDKVLRDMKRMHSVEDFKKIVNRFREEFRDIVISTDIIVGYPTESEDDFNKTIKIIKELKPEIINISKFSSRHGTFASKLKQLKSQEVKIRSKILSEVYKEIRKNKNKIQT